MTHPVSALHVCLPPPAAQSPCSTSCHVVFTFDILFLDSTLPDLLCWRTSTAVLGMLLCLTTQFRGPPSHLSAPISLCLCFSVRCVFSSLLYSLCAQICLSYYTVLLKVGNAVECECAVPKWNQDLPYSVISCDLEFNSSFGRDKGLR